jgi:hypothetical protein
VILAGSGPARHGIRVGFMLRFMAIGLVVVVLGFPGTTVAILETNDDGWADDGDQEIPTLKKNLEHPPGREVTKIPWSNGSGAGIRTGSAPNFVPPTARPRPEDPDAIAVVIANSGYRNGIPAVDYARNDGQAAQAMLRDIFGVRPGNIIVLEDAGQADLFTVFGNVTTHEGKLWSWVRPGRSKVYVYYSGHGVPGARDGRAYLLPVDADPGTAEINGYPLELLYGNLAKLGVNSVTVILESCFSGLTERGPLIRSASPVFLKSTQPTAGSGLTVLSAAQGDQIASWDHGAGLGMFTNYLVRALYGEADGGRWGNGDGDVTLGEIEAYLDDEMSYAARRQYQRVQQSSLVGDRRLVLGSTTNTSGPAASTLQPKLAKARRDPVRDTANPSRPSNTAWDGTLAGAESFLAENRERVIRSIKAFYLVEGKVWDEGAGGHGTDYGSDRMDSVSRLSVSEVTADSIELRVAYSWSNSYLGGAASGFMRLKMDRDGLWIAGMWR